MPKTIKLTDLKLTEAIAVLENLTSEFGILCHK